MQLSDSEQITSSDEECEHHASDEGRRRERLPASGQGEVREEGEQTVAGSSGDDGGQEELQVRGEDLPEIDLAEALLEDRERQDHREQVAQTHHQADDRHRHGFREDRGREHGQGLEDDLRQREEERGLPVPVGEEDWLGQIVRTEGTSPKTMAMMTN